MFKDHSQSIGGKLKIEAYVQEFLAKRMVKEINSPLKTTKQIMPVPEVDLNF